MSRLAFAVYKFLTALFNLASFRMQKVRPMEPPRKETISVVPFSEVRPRTPIDQLYDVKNFPKADHAALRLRRIHSARVVLNVLTKMAPRTTPEIPDNAGDLTRVVYHRLLRIAWPKAPSEPESLGSPDILASLAVSGPFADYLRKMSESDVALVGGGARATTTEISSADYCMDLAFLEKYPVKKGLLQVGGLAVMGVEEGRLTTKGIFSSPSGAFVPPGTELWEQARLRFLAGLNEHLTTIRHNVYIHLGYVTPMTVATFNRLSPDHPVRRLLHPFFQSTLIGNRELGQLQLRGKNAFASRIFSHEPEAVVRLINDSLREFSVEEMNPEWSAARRVVLETPFDYPHRDMVLEYWNLTRDAVARYLSVFYRDDGQVGEDPEIVSWVEELHRLLPGDQTSLDPSKIVLGKELLTTTCAAFMHTSTVTHDVVNNMVWDYSTINHRIPTVAPADGKRQPQLNSYELLMTLIGTWKPFNMMLEGEPFRATNELAQKILDEYLRELRAMLDRIPTSPRRPDRVYPDELNYSVSN